MNAAVAKHLAVKSGQMPKAALILGRQVNPVFNTRHIVSAHPKPIPRQLLQLATCSFQDPRLTPEIRENGIKANAKANIPMSNCGSLDDFAIELESTTGLIEPSIQRELKNARLGENDFVIQISQLNSNLCMVAKGKGSSSSVKLGDFQDCTSFRVDDDGLTETSSRTAVRCDFIHVIVRMSFNSLSGMRMAMPIV